MPRFRDKYLEWVEQTEVQLASMTQQPEILTMFQSARYWHIRGIDSSTPRPWPLVEAESNLQKAALERMAEDLVQRSIQLSAAPGRITVVDTNVLLHYLPPPQIPWASILRVDEVRLVVPLRVIEELDAKKYAKRSDLADRARRVLPLIEDRIGTAGQAGTLQDGVTIEVPIDPSPRRRPTDADEEILETCEELSQMTGRPVALVTGDTAMRIRAEARGIEVVRLPEGYERDRPTS